MLVDSHCHLDFADLYKDLQATLSAAKTRDVCYMQSICTRLGTFPKLLQIAKSAPNIVCSVGLHPMHIRDDGTPSAEEIADLCASQPRVVSIGETGLDYSHKYDENEGGRKNEELIECQKDSFIEHIKAARKAKLPLIIHLRDAYEDINKILYQYLVRGNIQGVIHSYTGDITYASAYIEMGLYISASGILTFKNATEIQKTFATIPLDRILLETDAPFLAPVPHRGEKNQPAYVRHTAEFLAKLRDISYKEVAETTTENFFRLFSKAEFMRNKN